MLKRLIMLTYNRFGCKDKDFFGIYEELRGKMQKNICICSDSLSFLFLRLGNKGKMGQNSDACGMILR